MGIGKKLQSLLDKWYVNGRVIFQCHVTQFSVLVMHSYPEIRQWLLCEPCVHSF